MTTEPAGDLNAIFFRSAWEDRLVSEIALIVTALGVLGVMVGLRQSYRERLRQFESMYVQRYWKILDQLSLEAVMASPTEDAGREDEKATRNYILLCEDELQCICSSVANWGVPRTVPSPHSKWLQSGSCRSLGLAPVGVPSTCTG